jgi:hypothetical protein
MPGHKGTEGNKIANQLARKNLNIHSYNLKWPAESQKLKQGDKVNCHLPIRLQFCSTAVDSLLDFLAKY